MTALKMNHICLIQLLNEKIDTYQDFEVLEVLSIKELEVLRDKKIKTYNRRD